MQGFRQGEQFLEAFGYSTSYETIVTFYERVFIQVITYFLKLFT